MPPITTHSPCAKFIAPVLLNTTLKLSRSLEMQTGRCRLVQLQWPDPDGSISRDRLASNVVFKSTGAMNFAQGEWVVMAHDFRPVLGSISSVGLACLIRSSWWGCSGCCPSGW